MARRPLRQEPHASTRAKLRVRASRFGRGAIHVLLQIMAYPLPTVHERRALFCWLDQASSLTAWRRLYSYNQRFVEVVRSVYEEEQRPVGMKQTIPTEWIADVL